MPAVTLVVGRASDDKVSRLVDRLVPKDIGPIGIGHDGNCFAVDSEARQTFPGDPHVHYPTGEVGRKSAFSRTEFSCLETSGGVHMNRMSWLRPSRNWPTVS
jgi:hypothetical protein